ncbi:diguanylate cyclase [Oxalobacteraceae bacterium OTU3CINTB1]|nr:diguanylate cyclase [Oxalobacteraceae bacterium OTU3CINTB1]
MRISDDSRPLSISVTIGCATSQPGETFEHYVDRADTALYRGKQAGRDRVVIADDASDMTAALDGGGDSGIECSRPLASGS